MKSRLSISALTATMKLAPDVEARRFPGAARLHRRRGNRARRI